MKKLLLFISIVASLTCLFQKSNAQSNQVLTNGSNTIAANFPPTGCLYTWVNNTPGIGLAASGAGNIPSFKVINTGSVPVIATITATPIASGFGYIANLSSNNVSVISTASNTLIGTIPVGLGPFSVSVSPDGSRAYVANSGSNTVSVINTATNTVISTIDVGAAPLGLIVSPDGSKVYVANSGSNTITVINATTNALLATFSAGTQPNGVSISPDGLQLYVSNGQSNNVLIINPLSGAVISDISVGSNPLTSAVSPDGKFIYVTNQTGSLSVIDNSGKFVAATIHTGGTPGGLVCSPDGTMVYVADPTNQKIYCISTASNIVASTISIPTSPQGISISPDGSHIYATDRSNTLFVISTITHSTIAKIAVGSYPVSIGNFITPNLVCNGSPVTFTITVNPTVPSINTSGTLTALTTTYGTASVATSFDLSGTNLSAGVLVTPPPGFQVSIDNVTFSNTVTIGNAGNIPSTKVYLRLSSIANAGVYSGNIVLSSAGVSNVNLPVAASTVNPAPVSFVGVYTKTYGTPLADYTLFYNTPGVVINIGDLKNGNTFNSVHLAFSAGAAADAAAGTYKNSVIQSSFTGRNGFLSSNYIITYPPLDLVIFPAPLIITANDVNKAYGSTLTGVAASTSFTATGLQNAETIGSVNIAYGAGAASIAPVGIYTGSVIPSAVIGGTFTASNYNITYVPANINVTAVVIPAIISTGELSALNTIYGTASASTSFNLSGTDLSTGVLITPPAGFEVSTDNITFSNTVTVGGAGNINNILVYVRLSQTTNTGIYSGNVTMSSAGATPANLLIPNSIVSSTPLTITANNVNKPYGTTLTDVTNSGGYTITSGSLKNGNTISNIVNAYGKGYDAPAAVGTYTGSILPTALIGANGFLLSNYKITYAAGDIIISPAVLTIQVNNITKTYGAVLTGGAGFTLFTAKGLANFETIGSISVSYSSGTVATDAIGNYANAATGFSATGGTFIAGNYTINYLAGNVIVNPATLVITADNKSKVYGIPNPALTYTYSGFVNNESTAQLTTLPAINTIATTFSTEGHYPITVSGGAAANYIFEYVNGELTITPPAVLIIPNAFTPNGDGVNDTWNLPALAFYPNCALNIFNRYGQSIYKSTGYGVPWDGRYNGVNVPAGVYYYIIDLKNNRPVLSGNLTVIR
jgi:gliding motility-associated-like protein